LPAGTSSSGAVPAIPYDNRHPRVYDDPDAFRPERLVDGGPDTYAWIPFGGGIRRCIGASFAQLEMRRVLQTVLARVQLRHADGVPARVTRQSIVYPPRDGARVTAAPRGEPTLVP
jgi:hypothetical protein